MLSNIRNITLNTHTFFLISGTICYRAGEALQPPILMFELSYIPQVDRYRIVGLGLDIR